MNATALMTTPLAHRALLAVGGEERASFLHGVLSCAVKDLAPGQGGWGALLTAQGKFLHDVFLIVTDSEILLDCEAERLEDLFTRLKRYRLRSKVTLEPRTDWSVHALWTPAADTSHTPETTPPLPAPGQAIKSGEVIYLGDPRLPQAGWRAYAPVGQSLLAEASSASPVDWDHWRCVQGLPDGSRDMAIEGATLLENGFAELGGVDFKKGCFVGQEVTARMRYRGLVKKRLLPITFDGAQTPLAFGAALTTVEGQNAGTLASVAPGGDGSHGVGLALIRLSARTHGPFTVEGTGASIALAPYPDWIILPDSKEDE